MGFFDDAFEKVGVDLDFSNIGQSVQTVGQVFALPYTAGANLVYGTDNPTTNLYNLPSTFLSGGNWREQAGKVLTNPMATMAISSYTGAPPSAVQSLTNTAAGSLLDYQQPGKATTPAQQRTSSQSQMVGGPAYAAGNVGYLPDIGGIDTKTILIGLAGLSALALVVIVAVKK